MLAELEGPEMRDELAIRFIALNEDADIRMENVRIELPPGVWFDLSGMDGGVISNCMFVYDAEPENPE